MAEPGTVAYSDGRRRANITGRVPRDEHRRITHASVRRKMTAAMVASAGLVSGLLFAMPANADTPDPGATAASASDFAGAAGFAGSIGSAAHGTAQKLQVSGGVVGPLVQRDSDGSTVSVTMVHVTNVDWARTLLEDGGWPTSQNNITVITQWMNSENGSESWWNRNNPLNNGYGSGGGSGFGTYPNLLVAADEAAAGLQSNGGYAGIISDFAASAAPATTASAIWASPWAGSHYDNGAIWHGGVIPTVAAPASAW